jgi:hypothetical protein
VLRVSWTDLPQRLLAVLDDEAQRATFEKGDAAALVARVLGTPVDAVAWRHRLREALPELPARGALLIEPGRGAVLALRMRSPAAATRFAARVADGQASGSVAPWSAVPSAALGPDADLEWHVAARGDHVELRVGELAAPDPDEHHAEFRFALESGGSRVALELRETVLTLRGGEGGETGRFDCDAAWLEPVLAAVARVLAASPGPPGARGPDRSLRAYLPRDPTPEAVRQSASEERLVVAVSRDGERLRWSVLGAEYDDHAALVAALIRRRALREHWQERDAGIVPEAVVVQPERGVSLGNVAETLDHLGLAGYPDVEFRMR